MTPGLRAILFNGWTPAALGSSLIAMWDAERTDLITQAAGLVSSWRDVVGGYDAAQAIGSSQPAYSAAGFNGRPMVVGDGIDDELSVAAPPTTIPIGAAGSELWGLAENTALVANTATRSLIGYGSAGTSSRILRRTSDGSNNRALMASGNAGGTVTSGSPLVELSGRHVMRGIVTPIDVSCEVDGVPSAPVAVVPTSNRSRLRLFANTSTTAAAFWQGGANLILITGPLQPDQAAALTQYLKLRGGIV